MATISNKNVSQKSNLPQTWNPIITLLQRRRNNKLKKLSNLNNDVETSEKESIKKKNQQPPSLEVILPYVKTSDKKGKNKKENHTESVEKIVVEKAIDIKRNEATSKEKILKSSSNGLSNTSNKSSSTQNTDIFQINGNNFNNAEIPLTTATTSNSENLKIENKVLISNSPEVKVKKLENINDNLNSTNSNNFKNESLLNGNSERILSEGKGIKEEPLENSENGEFKSPNSLRKWNPAHASYRHKKYENRPLKIENYEPGKSSIVLKDPFAINYFNPPVVKPGESCKYTNAKSNLEYKIQKKSDSLKSTSANYIHESYVSVQKGGDIPLTGLRPPTPPKKEHNFSNSVHHSIYEDMRHSSCSGAKSPDRAPRSALPLYDMGGNSPNLNMEITNHEVSPSLSQLVHGSGVRSMDRKTKDEINLIRKMELERFLDAARQKRLLQEEESNNARRHSDYRSSNCMSPVALNRYSDAFLNRSNSYNNSSSKKVKARALYKFQPQNPRELHLEVGNIVYIWRCIDDNWYEGEHHGSVGIFPVSYVEVFQCDLDTASIMEGQCSRVRYNFDSKDPSELSVKKGDIVMIKECVDDNWVRVVHNNCIGFVPISYLDYLPFYTPSISDIHIPGDLDSSVGSLLSTKYAGETHFVGESNKPFKIEPYSTSTMNASWDKSINKNESKLKIKEYGETNKDLLKNTDSENYKAIDVSPDKSIDFDPLASPVDFSRYLLAPSSNGDISGGLGQIRKSSNSSPLIKKETANDLLPFVVCQVIHNYEPEDKDELKLERGDLIDVTEVFDDGWYVGISHSSGHFGTFPGNYVKKHV